MDKEMMTVDEMAEELVAQRNKSGYTKRLYKQQADEHKEEVLQTDIENKVESLKAAVKRGRVDFSDVDQVQQRSYEYLEACGKAGVYPSVMGLATFGFGVTRQYLNQYILSHENKTVEFINMVRDMMADILTNASLFNNANAIQVIFQLKNHFEHTDRIDIKPVTVEENVKLQGMTKEELERKYLEGVVTE